MEKKDNYELKKCESCGAEFECGANMEGCWCTQAKLSESDAANLQVRFNDCLCPGCLERLSGAEAD